MTVILNRALQTLVTSPRLYRQTINIYQQTNKTQSWIIH